MVNFNPFSRRALKMLLAVIVCAGFVAIVLIFYYHQTPSQIINTGTKRYSRSTPLYSMRGFTYTGTYDGKKVIWFRADRLVIDKQKIGFLKFALLNRVHFENTSIKLFGQPRVHTAKAGEKGSSSLPDWTFENTFTKESLPSLPVKRIAAIEFEPITVELYNDDILLTRISARMAKVRIRKRTIHFEGGVQVVSGEKILRTSRLTLLPEKEMVKIKGHYTLKAFGKEFEGYDLTTDFLLENNEG